MTFQTPKHWSQRALLHGFVYGSLFVLLLCLFVSAFVFSETYLKKEQARESDSAELISHFFDSHYHGITQEMWSGSYDAIHMRISQIALQLGKATYDLILLDDQGKCVFRRKGPPEELASCEVPPALKEHFQNFQSISHHHSLQFDYDTDRYLYMAPIYVGSILKGYLYTAISDPYDFHRENSLILVMRIFGVPILCILFVWLMWLLISQGLILKPYLARQVEIEKKQAVAELAGKVAHNIQSPLVVVKSVARNIRGVDETQRRLLISATSRIEKIANHLISHFTSQKTNLDSSSFCFLWPVLDSSVAEKTSILGAKSPIDLSYQIGDELYGVGIPVSSEEIAAIFSNLMNNAIEAFDDKSSIPKKINILAQSIAHDRIKVEFSDSGKGMSSEILAKLKTSGGTYGKSNGAGFGLKHAKEVLAKVGGNVSIASELGKGTTVTLEIPLAPLPSWCPKVLDLSQAKSVVVLDDDPSVHLLWQQRLGQFPTTYLTDPAQFDLNRFPFETTVYILDYEIVGSPMTGLDLIVNHQLRSHAFLVTSYFNEQEIQLAVEQAGAMMLPKFMINRVQIEFGDRPFDSKVNSYDLVLIDDDPMIHELWHFEASQVGKRLQAVLNPSELDIGQLDPEIPIFVDKNLGNDISGVDVARGLYEKGFTNISLTSGERISKAELPEFIRELRNKDFPVKGV